MMSDEEEPLSCEALQRKEQIEMLLLQHPVNLQRLREHSRHKGGFLTHSLRARVWPKLLRVNRYRTDALTSYSYTSRSSSSGSGSGSDIMISRELDPDLEHKDAPLVNGDVERSLWNFAETSKWSANFRAKKRRTLQAMILKILARNPSMHYYQGYHDIVSIFMLVMGGDAATATVTAAVTAAAGAVSTQQDTLAPAAITPTAGTAAVVSAVEEEEKGSLEDGDFISTRRDSIRDGSDSDRAKEGKREGDGKQDGVIRTGSSSAVAADPPYAATVGAGVGAGVGASVDGAGGDMQVALMVAESATGLFFSDYMHNDFALASRFMRVIFTVVRHFDPDLHRYLEQSGMVPFFATGWLLTWFAHDLRSVSAIARLYDALLSSHPLYCFYLSAAYVIHLREALFECDGDFGVMHNLLVKAPASSAPVNQQRKQQGQQQRQIFDAEKLISAADGYLLALSVSELQRHCDAEIQTLVLSKSIALFSGFANNWEFADADWKLLEDSKMRPCARHNNNGYYSSGSSSSSSKGRKSWEETAQIPGNSSGSLSSFAPNSLRNRHQQQQQRPETRISLVVTRAREGLVTALANFVAFYLLRKDKFASAVSFRFWYCLFCVMTFSTNVVGAFKQRQDKHKQLPQQPSPEVAAQSGSGGVGMEKSRSKSRRNSKTGKNSHRKSK